MVIMKRLAGIAALVAFSAHAQDLAAYKIGDKAREDIVASVPFDVVDAQATDALKASKARTIAAIYHQFAGETNLVAKNFLAAFAQAHSDFSGAVASEYNQPTINNQEIESSDFGYFLTDYNVEHRQFPITTQLAVDWAHGDTGSGLRDEWLGLLLQAMNRPVQPDGVPPHFVYAKKIRIMPVTNLNEKFTFAIAWRRGHVLSADNVPTISGLRARFRQQFSETEQPIAGALAQFLQPNCYPDVAMTKDARDFTVRSMVAADHFEAGQVIVRRGETIDATAKAALDQLNKELMPGTLNGQIAAERAQPEEVRAQTERDAVQLAQQQQQQAQLDRDRAERLAQEELRQAAALREQALNAQILARKIRERDERLLAALGGVALLALAILWRWLRLAPTVSIPAPTKLQRMEKPGLPAELAPYLAQTLKEAVVQGLATQRAELLEAQRQAAAEIAELVQRLDQLQAPMQDRLRAYQERIQELQKDLAERTEENRLLLKLKIEMMRRQLEAEHGRMKFN